MAEPLPHAGELELVRAARRGDRTAFARIVDLHKQSVYGVAARMVGAADAQDISAALPPQWMQYRAFPNVGHGAWRDDADAAFAELRRFILE